MPKRQTTLRRLKKYSTGDLRDVIKIHVRALKSPSFGSASFSEGYDEGVDTWAGMFTPGFSGSGKRFFGDVNTGQRATDVFVIRFDSSITSENVVQFNGEYFKVLQVVDPDRRNEYLELDCVVLGAITAEANQ